MPLSAAHVGAVNRMEISVGSSAGCLLVQDAEWREACDNWPMEILECPC